MGEEGGKVVREIVVDMGLAERFGTTRRNNGCRGLEILLPHFSKTLQGTCIIHGD